MQTGAERRNYGTLYPQHCAGYSARTQRHLKAAPLGGSFLLIDEGSGATIAAGMVL